jgi:Flp pilus assembly protein TadB
MCKLMLADLHSEINKTKEEREKRKREIEGEKKKEKVNQGKQQGKIVGDQRVNQRAKPLKEGKKKKKKNHWFRNSGISVLVVLVLLL